jgi:hypothetical protein
VRQFNDWLQESNPLLKMDSQGIVYSDTTNIQRKYYHKNREEIMIISEGNLKSEH